MKTVSIPSKIIRTHKDGTVDTYHVRRAIGKGGFATVYEVSRLKSDLKYAIKAIPLANLKEDGKIKRQLEEINIQTSLNHPNILRSYDYFKDGCNLYMVLEFCPYDTVYRLLKNKGRFSELDAADIIQQVLEGVKYLHENSVIHRDIKLQNLLIGADGKIKISDFGISIKLSSQVERCYSTCGTYGFMPPEMLVDDNDGYSFESDIWSIGVCTFLLLTGQSPFLCKDKEQTERLIKKAEYRIPRHSHLSFASKDFIQSILQTNPENRPSIDDLLHHPFITNAQKTPHKDFFQSLLEKSEENRVSLEPQSLGPPKQCQEQPLTPKQSPKPNPFAQSLKPKHPKLYKPSPSKPEQLQKKEQHQKVNLSPQPINKLKSNPPQQDLFAKTYKNRHSKQRNQSPQTSEKQKNQEQEQLQSSEKPKAQENQLESLDILKNQEQMAEKQKKRKSRSPSPEKHQKHENQESSPGTPKDQEQSPEKQKSRSPSLEKQKKQENQKASLDIQEQENQQQSSKKQTKADQQQNNQQVKQLQQSGQHEQQQSKENRQKNQIEKLKAENPNPNEQHHHNQREEQLAQNLFAISYKDIPKQENNEPNQQDQLAQSYQPKRSKKSKPSCFEAQQDQPIETIKKNHHHSQKRKSSTRQKSPKAEQNGENFVSINDHSIPSYSVIRFCNKSKRGDLYYFMKNGQVGMISHDHQRLVLDPYGEFIQIWPNIDTNIPNIVSPLEANKIKNVSKLLKYEKAFKESNKHMLEIPESKPQKGIPMRHVKYWLDNENGLMFRMDNRVIQVNFTDKSKLIVFWEQKSLIFTQSIFDSGIFMTFLNLKESNDSELRKKYTITKKMVDAMNKGAW